MENTYVVYQENASECVVIDPGLDPDAIVRHLDSHSLTPVGILNTHGHSDHIAGNSALKTRWPDCPILIGEGDADKLTDPIANLSARYGVELISPPADIKLQDGETHTLAGIKWTTLHLPGHTAGHVVFVIQPETDHIVFAGDVLFQNSIGRTDFADSNPQQLIDSIHQQLFTLPDNTTVMPGHGDPTTIGQEKQHNPYVGIPAGYQP